MLLGLFDGEPGASHCAHFAVHGGTAQRLHRIFLNGVRAQLRAIGLQLCELALRVGQLFSHISGLCFASSTLAC